MSPSRLTRLVAVLALPGPAAFNLYLNWRYSHLARGLEESLEFSVVFPPPLPLKQLPPAPLPAKPRNLPRRSPLPAGR